MNAQTRGKPVEDRFASRPLYIYLAPRFWILWIALGFMRVSNWLPYPAQAALGRAAGRVMYRFLGKRRLIAQRNIDICFPQMDPVARQALVKKHFESIGLSLIEISLGWWASEKKIDRLMTLEGMEHLEAALARGKGVILLTGHFSSVEASGRLFARHAPPFKAMYRTNKKNGLLDEILRRGRLKSAYAVIGKDDVKTMLRTLRKNIPVLYAPDQAYDLKLSAMVPFFGVPATTNVATSQIARMTGAVVLPYMPYRLPDDKGYSLTILPPIDGFTGEDPVGDAQKYHAVLEQQILKDPAQYYWVHRRFKYRPESYPDLYRNLGAPYPPEP